MVTIPSKIRAGFSTEEMNDLKYFGSTLVCLRPTATVMVVNTVRICQLLVLTVALSLVGCGGLRPNEIRRQRALADQKRPQPAPSARKRLRKAPNKNTKKISPPTLIVRRKPTPINQKKRENKAIVERCEELLPLAKRITKEIDIDLSLVMAVARVESSYNPAARNRRSGATGLMQVMPSTGRGFKCGNLRDAETNLRCGARILKRYLAYFDNELIYGVAAYHSGPVAPKKARAAKRLPRNMNYVEKVLKLRTRFRRQGCG